MSYQNQLPAISLHRLDSKLTADRSIRDKSFAKQQQIAAAAKQQAHSRDHRLHEGRRPLIEPYFLKTVRSTSALPRQREGTRARSSSSRSRSRPSSQKAPAEKVQEAQWQSTEIPPELEELSAGIPEEVRNIIQESMDKHRAMRASRQHLPQAIVVRTTITQSRTSRDHGSHNSRTEVSASASSRRTRSPSPDDVSSPSSLSLGSRTSLGSSEADSSLLRPPSMYDTVRPVSSEEDLNGETGMKIKTWKDWEKPLKERAVFKVFGNRKGKDVGYKGCGDDGCERSECRSCHSDLSSTTSISLTCRHQYCSHCFTDLLRTTISSESTFPPRCCFQEIPRQTILAHMSPNYIDVYNQKSLEYSIAVGNRHYCASPECAKWIDFRTAYAYGGALRCPHCAHPICTACQGQAHGKRQDCSVNFALQQADRAAWQRCFQCRAVVEPNASCGRVVCKCRAQIW